MIFGGWNTENLNTIFLLRETSTGFQIQKSRVHMEQADSFPINGVWGEDEGDLLLPGFDYVHRLNVKALTLRQEREIL